ncbi:HAD family phosphatase [Vibrio sp. TH_r3]|uniref:HAD family hydrolase n=1 Tax=Vibrio sp. TH_r3 TaxID=3082084 RepID=UPI0029547DB6|nr:HAD family phosphatase [Vibrio sp. TH_r3]MDV7103095.1 HAD family phosphatase [Vibrio sp. TH_r3]
MCEVILFDLGRVVVDLGPSPIPKSWLSKHNYAQVEPWLSSQVGRQFEKGQITAFEFVTQLKQQFMLSQSNEEIIDAFIQWPIGIYPNLINVLIQLRENYHLAVLSNTNELHFPRLIEEFAIAEYFDTIFVSHHMHKAKPDIEAFEYVLQVLDVSADNVLFLDDNQQNIQAAKSLGINSVQVCGEIEVLEVLQVLKEKNLW